MRKQRLFSILFILVFISSTIVASTPIIRFVRPKVTGDGTSWKKASSNIQAMIDTVAALGGGEVWVSEGIYKPSNVLGSKNERDASFLLRPGVKLYGGIDSHETEELLITHCKRDRIRTILTGDLVGDDTDDESTDYKTKDDNVYHVVLALAGANEEIFIDGFTISGGYADGLGISETHLSYLTYGIRQTDGAGIYAKTADRDDRSSVKIINCNITGNKALATIASYGGGVYAEGAVVVMNNRIADNQIHAPRSVGAGLYLKSSSVGLIEGNTILKNRAVASSLSESAYGGGVYAEGVVRVTRNIIDENYVSSPSYAYGGGLFALESITIVNNQIANNSVYSSTTKAYGGGVFATGFSNHRVTLLNNTIVQNTIEGKLTKGSGVFNNGYASMYNTVLWANKNGDEEKNSLDNEGDGNQVKNCLIQGVSKDLNSTNLDGVNSQYSLTSLFVYDIDNQNKYIPKGGSILINSGDNSFYQQFENITTALDLKKKDRLSGKTIDLGAYEVQLLSEETGTINVDTSDSYVYPTQTSGIVYIQKEGKADSLISVYSITGRFLVSTRENQIDLSGFPKGVYLFKLKAKTIKVVKL